MNLAGIANLAPTSVTTGVARSQAARVDFATSNVDSGYAGMTSLELKTSYDQAFPSSVWVAAGDTGFPAGVTAVTPVGGATPNYCILSQNGNWYAWKRVMSFCWTR